MHKLAYASIIIVQAIHVSFEVNEWIARIDQCIATSSSMCVVVEEEKIHVRKAIDPVWSLRKEKQ